MADWEEMSSGCGYLIGPDVATPLYAVSSAGAAPFSLDDQPRAAQGLLSPGLRVVGFYCACEGGAGLASFLQLHAAALRAVEGLPVPVLAAAATSTGVEWFTSVLATDPPALTPLTLGTRAAIRGAFDDAFVALRARMTLAVAAHAPPGGAGWASAMSASLHASLQEMKGAGLCAAFPGAPHVGILGGDTWPSIPCGALLDKPAGSGGAAAGLTAGGADDDGDDDDDGGGDDDDDDPNAPVRGGKKKGGGGAKGKKGKKGRVRGGRGGGAVGATAIGEGAAAGAAAGPVRGVVDVRLLQALSPAGAPRTCAAAPVLNLAPVSSARAAVELHADVVYYAERGMLLAEAVEDVTVVVFDQLATLMRELGAATAGGEDCSALTAAGFCFEPAVAGSHLPLLICPAYVLRAADSAREESMAQKRQMLHARLGLPADRPLLRSSNAYGSASSGGGISGLLRDAHEGLPPSGVKGGKVSLVQGSYEYYHYMQPTGTNATGRYDDEGWGCAYRSLMSILSWYRLQQYTAFGNPTHYEIQQRLVDHCAADATYGRGGLLGRKQWIGSVEVGEFLMSAIGATCKSEYCRTGDEVLAKGRKLQHHFETQGTPVMIGGGELAFTLLGVHFNDQTGDLRFLIMDPHYTGPDDVSQIHSGKWIGWKKADSLTHLSTKLFDAKNSYHFCLPQRLAEV